MQKKTAHKSAGRSIGAILADSGRLSLENAERILRLQKEQGKRFGDAAIELGLLTEDDIRFALSRQFDYPYLSAGDNSLSQELVAAYKPFSKTVEQLRALRSQLMLRWFDTESQRKSLAVVSPGHGEGRSFIAANLAIVFSQLGERTLLIDADLRSPRQHMLFKLGNNAGLSDMLAGRVGSQAIVRVPSLLGLSILPAGAVPPNPQELLGRQGFTDVLESLCRHFDVVILDTPAGSEYADTQTLAVRAGAALMVTRKNESTVADVVQLARSLQQSGASLVGSVLNDV
ncbi:chain length determinant protein tyrosine kinase EpsG [Chitinimonas arctica]|uniref:Chain length determinant protein tyrosine kinase EpsG n=1 Tax=Chitinimonas arctica TaxID=2594795 RepID=A0A516SM75_9NEIS|nr:chain length determinant protein tyrosine kinase EpsG [Chitinimonas arctica]